MKNSNRKRKAASGILCLLSFVLLCLMSGCGGKNMNAYIGKQIGLSLPNCAKIKYTDTHGGNGDGDLYAVVSFPDSKTAAQFSGSLAKADWPTKFTDDMVPWFYGGAIVTKGEASSTDGYFRDMNLDVPKVKNGYFFYRDRYREQYGEPCSFAPYTWNFTMAVFDSDTDTLYFIEGDS